MREQRETLCRNLFCILRSDLYEAATSDAALGGMHLWLDRKRQLRSYRITIGGYKLN